MSAKLENLGFCRPQCFLKTRNLFTRGRPFSVEIHWRVSSVRRLLKNILSSFFPKRILSKGWRSGLKEFDAWTPCLRLEKTLTVRRASKRSTAVVTPHLRNLCNFSSSSFPVAGAIPWRAARSWATVLWNSSDDENKHDTWIEKKKYALQ